MMLAALPLSAADGGWIACTVVCGPLAGWGFVRAWDFIGEKTGWF